MKTLIKIVFLTLLSTNLFAQINLKDANETAKIAVGLVAPDSIQAVTADVDMDGRILCYDAALIARFVAGFNDSNCHCGEIVIINGKKAIIGDVYKDKKRLQIIE